MKWIYERFIRPGKRDIIVSRTLGSWEIRVNGCGQTTPYTNAMWEDAYSRIEGRPINHVLLLGLGAGGSIPIAHRRFPRCRITAVEYDPQMISLTRELKLYKPWDFPNVIEGDAATILPMLEESFDLIVMDLFDGPEPSPLTTDANFLSHIKHRLTSGGIFLANVYKRRDYLQAPQLAFHTANVWQFGGNTLGIFTDI